MIEIHVGSSPGVFLVYSADDSIALRSKHRIVSSYLGTLAAFPSQNRHLALPSLLSVEQVFALLSNGDAMLIDDVRSHALLAEPGDFNPVELERHVSEKLRYFQQRREDAFAAKAILKELHMRDRSGKSSETISLQNASPSTKPTHPQKSSTAVSSLLKDSIHKRMPQQTAKKIQHPDLQQSPLVAVSTASDTLPWYNPTPVLMTTTRPSEDDILQMLGVPAHENSTTLSKCKIFVNLWERGYYLTSAIKYGGDFLLYPGDPLLHHASHVVVCVPLGTRMTPFDIVAYARMGRNAKKKILLMQYDPEIDTVSEMVLNWTGWK
ncbi:hypothetical protein BC830DRAFT_1143198 [Chytriomyces sp. MP71]|nr:hypothetical protein BC830DRAFT_1143198 [Chytriomyces sp. MP71]